MNKSTPHTTINTNPFTRCFRGFDMLFKYNQGLAIVLLVFSLVSGLLQFAQYFIPAGDSSGSSVATNNTEPVNWALVIAIVVPIIVIALMVVMVISTYINGITNFIAWKTSRQQATTLSEAVREVTKRFWTILVVQVLVFLRILGGFLLFIVPGIRASLRYQMVLFPVFDEGLNASHAIRRIKDISRNHLMEIFGVMTASNIIPFVGLLLQLGGEAVLYPELKHMHETNTRVPVHWLNYLAFIIIGAVIGITLLTVALVLAF